MDADELKGIVSPIIALAPTYSPMFLASLVKMARANPEHGMSNIDDQHFTSTGACAYFTDPTDGQKYRVTVEPVWGNDKFDYTTSQVEHLKREKQD